MEYIKCAHCGIDKGQFVTVDNAECQAIYCSTCADLYLDTCGACGFPNLQKDIDSVTIRGIDFEYCPNCREALDQDISTASEDIDSSRNRW